MKKFTRKFEPELLRSHVGNERSLIGALLDRWVLPGESCPSGLPLRLAVRDGYLNLYVNGQSVAKISTPRNKPRIEVHWKYVGIRDGKKDYRTFAADEAVDDAAAIVDQWILRADGYSGDEKRFVEHLVARNPNVIDLEMGLPGDPNFVSSRPEREGKTGLFAPRMDLVVVHPEAGQSTVEFWEAKLATNGELRARDLPDKPKHKAHVLFQLDDYTRWVENRASEVEAAYAEALQILRALADICGKQGRAREIWQEATRNRVQVNPRPGIIIANYHPQSGDLFAKAASFGVHLDKLEAADCRVRQVKSTSCDQGVLWAGSQKAAA